MNMPAIRKKKLKFCLRKLVRKIELKLKTAFYIWIRSLKWFLNLTDMILCSYVSLNCRFFFSNFFVHTTSLSLYWFLHHSYVLFLVFSLYLHLSLGALTLRLKSQGTLTLFYAFAFDIVSFHITCWSMLFRLYSEYGFRIIIRWRPHFIHQRQSKAYLTFLWKWLLTLNFLSISVRVYWTVDTFYCSYILL